MVHLILYVSDQEAATQFYENLIRKSPRLQVPGMTEFEIDQTCILGLMPENGIAKLLGNKTPDPSTGSGIPRAELYLFVDSPIDWYNRALALGANEVSEAQLRDWSHEVAYCTDRDGHVLAFAKDVSSAYHTEADTYDQWFDENSGFYESELLAIKDLLPSGNGLEVGVGSGRFASRLGIRFGVEPSPAMAKLATKRGVNTSIATAESLPFVNETFDFVLFVTSICFIQDPKKAIQEANRVLKENAYLLLAFIDKESELGQKYEAVQHENPFYRDARFYSASELKLMVESEGFNLVDSRQTLFPSVHTEIQSPEASFGKGSFVVHFFRKN